MTFANNINIIKYYKKSIFYAYRSSIKKNLNAAALNSSIKEKFAEGIDPRCQKDLGLPDTLMSGFAMFQFKDHSLLAFNATMQR